MVKLKLLPGTKKGKSQWEVERKIHLFLTGRRTWDHWTWRHRPSSRRSCCATRSRSCRRCPRSKSPGCRPRCHKVQPPVACFGFLWNFCDRETPWIQQEGFCWTSSVLGELSKGSLESQSLSTLPGAGPALGNRERRKFLTVLKTGTKTTINTSAH